MAVDGMLHYGWKVMNSWMQVFWLRSVLPSHGSLLLLDGVTGEMAVAAITGLVAKENVVGTFGIVVMDLQKWQKMVLKSGESWQAA